MVSFLISNSLPISSHMSFHDLPPMASVRRAASLKEVKGRGQTGTNVDRNYQRKALEPGEPLK